MNAWVGAVAPSVIDGFDGLTVIEAKGAGLTVSTVPPETPAEAAEMVVVPAATPVARPALTVATEGALELQLAEAVRSLVVLSLKVPVAVNCWVAAVAPNVMDGLDGVTWMETSVGLPPPPPPPFEPPPPQPTSRLRHNKRIDSSNRFIGTPWGVRARNLFYFRNRPELFQIPSGPSTQT